MNWMVIGIIALAFGLVIGNIMLLKHTANMKMPSLKDKQTPQHQNKQDAWDEDDDWGEGSGDDQPR